MTVKKCDKCGVIYKKGYILSYGLDNFEVGKSLGELKPNCQIKKDLCETCAGRLKMFLRSQEEEIREND